MKLPISILAPRAVAAMPSPASIKDVMAILRLEIKLFTGTGLFHVPILFSWTLDKIYLVMIVLIASDY